MASSEDQLSSMGRPTTSQGWLERLLNQLSPEPVVLVAIAALFFAFLVIGHQLGLW
jgi:hypothetical protein